ncbi:MAG: Gfo/Idh/MocA family oxidoreductase [Deinococcus sp.]|nr:Gfo/Idh/MocA family oxidoreductase [Deinococcus sp.]
MPKTKSQISIGVIGVGQMGRIHAEHIVRRVHQARLVAVADVDAKRAQAVAEALGAPRWYGSPEELLQDKTIDAVVIVTSTDTHADMIVAAAKAGKDIFCEKPIADTVPDGRRAQAAVERAGVRCQIGFMRRFDPAYVTARKQLDDGAIGRPLMIRLCGRDPTFYRRGKGTAFVKTSGGIFLDMCIHDFDLARWLMGAEVSQVFAKVATLGPPEVHQLDTQDSAVALLTYSDGRLGVAESSLLVPWYDIRTELVGTKGTLQVGALEYQPVTVMSAAGIIEPGIPWFMERFGEAYVAELQHFISALASDQVPAVNAGDGVAALAISLAALQSAETGQPVNLVAA